MKNILSILKHAGKMVLIPVFLFVMIISSCEDTIDLQPYSSISETTAFSSPSLVALSVTGMYQAAQLGYFAANYRGYPFGAAFVEQGDCRGEDVVNMQAFYQFTYEGTYNLTTANNRYYWEDTYRLINRTNIIIEGVTQAVADGIISEAQGNIYLGEARFMRAISHLELLFHFAAPYKHTADASHPGVPYRDRAYITLAAIDEGTAQSRNTVADCYSRMLADLDFAENNLPGKSERSGSEKITRATKGAAIAYKTRVYQHMWDWTKVISEGGKLLAFSGGDAYEIASDPNEPFGSPYSNSESVFSIENSATNYPSVNGALPQMYKRRLLVCMSPIIWRDPAWLTDDKRRDSESGQLINDQGGVIYTNKYKDDVNSTDPAPVIRYAEVMLNLAEAYCRNAVPADAPDANALLYLNMVRDRSLANPATQAFTAADFADNIALLGAILKERRIELAMEGRRWPDIHRLQFCPHYKIDGIPQKLANAAVPPEAFTLGTPYDGPYGVDAIPYSNYRFLWPIPQSELDINPTLKAEQNPGW
jgi:hypothetical protein